MTGLGGLDNSTCKRILDLLEASYLRLGETVIKRIKIINSEVNNRGGNGGGYFGIIMRSHSVTCHLAEVTFLSYLCQLRLVIKFATPKRCKAELT